MSADEISNRVAQSGLITLDLAETGGDWIIAELDISGWLAEGLLLREKDFRASVAGHDWEQYRNKAVHVCCSTDAIVPLWAYLLIASQLNGIAELAIVGNRQQMETELWRRVIRGLDLEQFRNQRLVIKGCSDFDIHETIYLELAGRLTPVVRSLMFGEPCSTVPILKKK